MKKVFLTYLAILVGLFVILSILGLKGEYVVEQKLWKVQQQYNDISRDPAVVPDSKFEEVARQYQQIIDKYPKAGLVQRVHILLGRVYFMKKDYQTAREKFAEIPKKYPQNKELVAEAIVSIGKTYEVEEDWLKAHETYQSIIRDYPLTEVGLGIPIYIAHYFRSKNDYREALNAYDLAIRYYKNIASENRQSSIGFNALRYLATTYLDQRRWSEAVDTLGDALMNYAISDYLTERRAETMIKSINVIAAYQLKDYDVAINLYENIIKTRPDHPLNDYLKKVVTAFRELKEKGVQVSTAPSSQEKK